MMTKRSKVCIFIVTIFVLLLPLGAILFENFIFPDLVKNNFPNALTAIDLNDQRVAGPLESSLPEDSLKVDGRTFLNDAHTGVVVFDEYGCPVADAIAVPFCKHDRAIQVSKALGKSDQKGVIKVNVRPEVPVEQTWLAVIKEGYVAQKVKMVDGLFVKVFLKRGYQLGLSVRCHRGNPVKGAIIRISKEGLPNGLGQHVVGETAGSPNSDAIHIVETDVNGNADVKGLLEGLHLFDVHHPRFIFIASKENFYRVNVPHVGTLNLTVVAPEAAVVTVNGDVVVDGRLDGPNIFRNPAINRQAYAIKLSLEQKFPGCIAFVSPPSDFLTHSDLDLNAPKNVQLLLQSYGWITYQISFSPFYLIDSPTILAPPAINPSLLGKISIRFINKDGSLARPPFLHLALSSDIRSGRSNFSRHSISHNATTVIPPGEYVLFSENKVFSSLYPDVAIVVRPGHNPETVIPLVGDLCECKFIPRLSSGGTPSWLIISVRDLNTRRVAYMTRLSLKSEKEFTLRLPTGSYTFSAHYNRFRATIEPLDVVFNMGPILMEMVRQD